MGASVADVRLARVPIWVPRQPAAPAKAGAIYWADNGRVICAKWAGMSACCTCRDISGQQVTRATVEDVRAWPGDRRVLRCASGCTALAAVAGPAGWPLARRDVS